MSTVLRALTTRPAHLADVGLLVGRLVVGGVFLAHGQQKLSTGIEGTGVGFEQMGVPAPTAAATFQALLETVGGVLLIVGALTTVIGLLLAASMVAAGFIAHSGAFFVSDGGWELVGVLAATSLLLALAGPGRLSVDGVLSGRLRRS